MNSDFAKLARMELAWVLGKTDARDIQVEAFTRMESALRKVAEATRRQCAEVLREHGLHCHPEEAEGLEFLARKIEALGTAPTCKESLQVDPLADVAAEMLTGHTPGPWTVVGKEERDHPGEERRIEGGGKLIACVGNAEDWTVAGPEWDSNAALIAAAPDMLAALQEVVRISDRKHDAWDNARVAIAKAKAAGAHPKDDRCPTCKGRGVYDSFDEAGRAHEMECYACGGSGRRKEVRHG